MYERGLPHRGQRDRHVCGTQSRKIVATQSLISSDKRAGQKSGRDATRPSSNACRGGSLGSSLPATAHELLEEVADKPGTSTPAAEEFAKPLSDEVVRPLTT
jgi:hypothetical protein